MYRLVGLAKLLGDFALGHRLQEPGDFPEPVLVGDFLDLPDEVAFVEVFVQGLVRLYLVFAVFMAFLVFVLGRVFQVVERDALFQAAVFGEQRLKRRFLRELPAIRSRAHRAGPVAPQDFDESPVDDALYVVV